MPLTMTGPDPAATVEHLPGTETPRLSVTVQGGRAGRTEALDVPADLDGLQHLADWLTDRVGWAIVTAEVIP